MRFVILGRSAEKRHSHMSGLRKRQTSPPKVQQEEASQKLRSSWTFTGIQMPGVKIVVRSLWLGMYVSNGSPPQMLGVLLMRVFPLKLPKRAPKLQTLFQLQQKHTQRRKDTKTQRRSFLGFIARRQRLPTSNTALRVLHCGHLLVDLRRVHFGLRHRGPVSVLALAMT